MCIIRPSPLDDVSYHGSFRISVPRTPFHVVRMFASGDMEYKLHRIEVAKRVSKHPSDSVPRSRPDAALSYVSIVY
jgi:hypothetical protein